MPITVHYYDRRNGDRKVVEESLDWHGPFWWSPDGNAGCDCNRSVMMYRDDPAKHLGCSAYINLIQIEKIVNAGEVVYQETVSELPPLVVAVLVAKDRFLELQSLGSEEREKGKLEQTIKQLEAGQQALAACEDTTALVNLCRQAVESGNKIAAYESDDTVVLDVVAERGKLDEMYSEFAELADRVTDPFRPAD